MKYVRVIKPGTNKSQLVETDRVEFYKQYGWEPVVQEATAVVRPRKTTVKAEPAVEEQSSEQEVLKDDNKGD